MIRRFINWLKSLFKKEPVEPILEPITHREIDYGLHPKFGRRCVWCNVIRTPEESRYDRCKYCRQFQTRKEMLKARNIMFWKTWRKQAGWEKL